MPRILINAAEVVPINEQDYISELTCMILIIVKRVIRARRGMDSIQIKSHILVAQVSSRLQMFDDLFRDLKDSGVKVLGVI